MQAINKRKTFPARMAPGTYADTQKSPGTHSFYLFDRIARKAGSSIG
jgi:hypothetical protein